MVPVFNPEKGSHLRHAPAYRLRRQTEIFQTEGELMPDFVGDDLRLGVLHDDADPFSRFAVGENVWVFRAGAFASVLSREEDASAHLSEGGKLALDQAEKGGFSAAGETAEDRPLPFRYGQGYAVKGVGVRVRISEGYILDR